MLASWFEEAIESMHHASLEVLERAGVKVDEPQARHAMVAFECAIGEEDRVTIPTEVVEQALAVSRKSLHLVARGAGRALAIDADPTTTYVHSMRGAPRIMEPRTGATRRATLRDQWQLARVMHNMEHVHCICNLASPGDVPLELEPLYTYLAIARETDKLVRGPGLNTLFDVLYLSRMAQEVTGADGDDGRYPLDLAWSSVSPLHFDGLVTDGLMAALDVGGIVIEVMPCPIAGTTVPATMVGADAMQNAEVLAGIVLIQAVAPGTAVYNSACLMAADPQTGLMITNGPACGLLSVPSILLARRYGLACDAYGPTSCDAVAIDAWCGYDSAFNALVGLLPRPRLMSGIGDMHGGLSTCPEKLIADEEVLACSFCTLSDHPWDADALDVDGMVDVVLSGSSFLGTKNTRKYMRTEFLPTTASHRRNYPKRVPSDGYLVDLMQERVAEMMARGPTGLADEVDQKPCSIIDEAARDLGLQEWPDPRTRPLN